MLNYIYIIFRVKNNRSSLRIYESSTFIKIHTMNKKNLKDKFIIYNLYKTTLK